MTSSLSPLLALAAPLVLWPVEYVLPFPALVEEFAKAAFIYLGPKISQVFPRLSHALLIGVIFAFSESILYLFNYLQLGTPQLFLLRLLYTIPLHCLTCLLIALPSPHNRLLRLLTLSGAILLHFLYNSSFTPYLARY